MIQTFLSIINKILDLVKIFQEKFFQKNKIDKEIFIDSDNILNEEAFSHLFDSAYNLRYSFEQNDLIDNYKNYFFYNNDKIKSKIYNNKHVRKSFDKFMQLFLELFGGVEWFVSDRHESHFELDSELKKADYEAYSIQVQKIKNLSFNANNAYKEYRKKIKKIFGI